VASTEPLVQMPVHTDCNAQAKIALIDVDGLLLNMDMAGLYSHGENPVALFREKLDNVSADGCVRVVVLRINSPGGGVTACDIMRHDLEAFKARTGLPVIACLLDVGAGGAYYLATAADQIVVHPTTVTGGLGVILNLYNLQDMMAQFNIVGTPLKAGQFTDLGSPVRKMPDDARKILQQMADDYHARLRSVVLQSRPRVNPQQAEVFDGRVFTGQQAFDLGLADQVGYLDDAIAAARQATGGCGAQVVLFHRCIDRAYNQYAVTPNVPIQTSLIPISVPGLDRSRLPTFLYMWQPDPSVERLTGR
jgi:protease-4